jgi:hypothetical protein
LYGNLNRNQSILQHVLLIIDTYLNDKGEDVYYLVFCCDPWSRSFEKYEHTDSIVIDDEVTKKGKWNEEININFTENTAEKNEELVSEYYKKYRDTLTLEERKI